MILVLIKCLPLFILKVVTISPDNRASGLGKIRIESDSDDTLGVHVSQGAVGRILFVFDTSVLDFFACIFKTQKLVHVQIFVLKTAVERFDERMLRGFSGP